MCEKLDPSEQLLSEALLEVLTEEVNHVPDETRIKRTHRLSKDFRKRIRLIMKHYGMEEEDANRIDPSKKWQRLLHPAAACLLAGVVIYGSFYALTQSSMKKLSNRLAAREDAGVIDSTEAALDEAAEDSQIEYDTAEDLQIESNAAEDSQVEGKAEASVSSTNGVFVYLDADGYQVSKSMKILVENTSDQSVEIKSGMLKVYQDGAWTALKDEKNETLSNIGRMVPAGESVTIEVDLSNWSIPEEVIDAAYILLIEDEYMEVSFGIENDS